MERQSDSRVAAGSGGTDNVQKRISEQSLLKYQKLYNWAHTLITSGVIQNDG